MNRHPRLPSLLPNSGTVVKHAEFTSNAGDICCHVERDSSAHIYTCVISKCEDKLPRGKILIYLSHITTLKFAFLI